MFEEGGLRKNRVFCVRYLSRYRLIGLVWVRFCLLSLCQKEGIPFLSVDSL